MPGRSAGGTYENVTILLGPDFEGTWPVTLPPGITVTRDTSVFTEDKGQLARTSPIPSAIRALPSRTSAP